MTDHALADLVRDPYTRLHYAICSCGEVTGLHQQQSQAKREFKRHVAEMSETEVVKP